MIADALLLLTAGLIIAIMWWVATLPIKLARAQVANLRATRANIQADGAIRAAMKEDH